MDDKEEQIDGPFGEGLFRSLAAPAIIPTTIRQFKTGNYKDFLNFSKKEKAKHLVGLVLGSAGQGAAIMGASMVIPEALLGLAATNIGSGIYELGRAGLRYVGSRYIKRTLE